MRAREGPCSWTWDTRRSQRWSGATYGSRTETRSPPPREVHIINYADKRVRHDTVVSLEERFIDLVERYGSSPERRVRIGQMREATLELEGNIFRRIDSTPDDLQAFNALAPFDLETIPPQLSGGSGYHSEESV